MKTDNFDKRTEVAITLEFPVTVDGEKIETITIRRPKTKDTIAAGKMPGGSAEQGLTLFARLCNVSPDVIAELDEIDAATLNAQYRSFTGRQSA